MNGTSIRNIKRNISEAATGTRCNRYGKRFSFKNYRKPIASWIAGLFRLPEYLKHRANRRKA